MSESSNFQVNLRGVIELLSNHLYSSPRVFFRELLQNSIDAITARRLSGHSRFETSIGFELVADGAAPTLVVEDNGIGLTREEIDRFLATIGESSKKDDFGVRREGFIGQFGIGLLSCFLVADRIVAITRSVAPGSPALRWTGHDYGSYTLEEIDSDLEAGTRVYISPRNDSLEWFSKRVVEEALRYYGLFLKEPVSFRCGSYSARINLRRLPWENPTPSRDSALLEFGTSLLNVPLIGHIDLCTKGVSGVAYILAQPIGTIHRSHHRLYTNGILVSDQCDSILPDWAFFLRAVVSCDQLSLMASREEPVDGPQLWSIRDTIGDIIKQKLRELSRTDPQLLDHLLQTHMMAIKAMCLDDNEFFEVFIDWMEFETSLGRMSFRRMRELGEVFLATRLLDYRQMAPYAAAKRVCLVNGSIVYDASLIKRAGEIFEGFEIRDADPYDFFEGFQLLTVEEKLAVAPFLDIANRTLRPHDCHCEMRKFAPSSQPAVYAMNESAKFLRSAEKLQEKSDSLFSSVLDSLAVDFELTASCVLHLNYDNSLVRRLIAIKDERLVSTTVEVLYVQSLLLGQHSLGEGEMNMLSVSLTSLLEEALSP